MNDWNFIDYYVEQTLDYCKRSRIMTQEEIDELRITRIQKHKGAKKGFQSFSKNLSDSIYNSSEMHKMMIDYFHLLDNDSKHKDQSETFFNCNS